MARDKLGRFQKGNDVGKECRFQKGILSDYSFKKDNIPWNKGLKGIHLSPKTEFKKGHIHSEATKRKIRKTLKDGGRTGEKNHKWKGGRWKDRGYIQIYKPEHKNANNNGYVREHRLLIEKKLGRYLTKEEMVYHINGIRDDNRIKNLKLFKNRNECTKYCNLHPKKSTYKRIINFVSNIFKNKK